MTKTRAMPPRNADANCVLVYKTRYATHAEPFQSLYDATVRKFALARIAKLNSEMHTVEEYLRAFDPNDHYVTETF
jgi:hypothetical protein